MTHNSNETQRKAVLAALLAVRRGLISPEAAVDLIGGEGIATPKSGAMPDPVGTILRVNPTVPKQGLTRELDQLLQDPQAESMLWKTAGLNAEQRRALESMQPDRDSDRKAAREALAEVARERVRQLRSRLPDNSQARYTAVREFARGGMGRIMIATDHAVGREVALKEILVSAAGDPADTQPETVERFLREAKVTGQLEHPNIVPVYEISKRDDGSIFYTMKLVRGRTLYDRLEQIAAGPGSEDEKLAERLKLLEAFLDVCHAVAYAHSRGVIHRDLKPQNIVLGDFGETVLLDWGLARVRAEDVPQAANPGETPRFSQSLLRHARESHTLDGAIMGTPAYMSPEQAQGLLELVDERSDIYALGAILYEILAGRPPYSGVGPETIVAEVVAGAPRPLREISPSAPADLVSLAAKAMARRRDDRLESAERLASEIAAFRDGRNISVHQYSSLDLLRRFVARNRGAVAVGSAAALALAVVITFSVLNIRTERDTARDALAKAESAESARLAAVSERAAERERLVQQRRAKITQTLQALAALGPEPARARVQQTVSELDALSPVERTTRDLNHQEIAGRVSDLLAVTSRRAELQRLATEPVAGEQVELLPPAEDEANRSALLTDRLLAARLATLNRDFGLADAILADTQGPADVLAAAAADLRQARESLIRYRQARLSEVLAAIRTGQDARGVINTARLSELIAEVGAWRTPQVVELLRPVQQAIVNDPEAAQQPVVWDVRKRMQVQFIAGVLGQTGLPEVCIPMLAELMMSLQDRELVIETTVALCRLEHPAAWHPLAELAGRHGFESLIWRRVRRQFWRVPVPADLPEPASAEQCLERARLFHSRRRTGDELPGGRSNTVTDVYRRQEAFEQSKRYLHQALSFDPAHFESMLFLARVNWDSRVTNDENPQLFERLLATAPENPRLLSLYAEWLYFYDRTRAEDCLRFARRAVELAPADGAIRLTNVRVMSFTARDFSAELHAEAVEAVRLWPDNPDTHYILYRCFDRRELTKEAHYAAGLKALNAAIELDPDEAEMLAERANLHLVFDQTGYALQDANRAIELRPGRHFAYVARYNVRMVRKDYAGALADADIIFALTDGGYTPVYLQRADALEGLGRLTEAIEMFRQYLRIRPEFQGNDRVRDKLAELEQRVAEGE